MDNNTIIKDVTGHVATLTFNRPDMQNAFDEGMIADLHAALDALADKHDITAVVLRGKGKSFSAGADLGWMKRAAGYDEARNREDAGKLAAMLFRLYTLPQVTIAAVHGVAMGGGLGLACCCDIVIADQSAVFSTSEVKLGLVPATIAPYVIAAIGARQAGRYFQTAERITTDKAQEIGLVHEVVGRAEDIEARLEAILVSIGENGPQAMRTAKQLCRELDGQPITQAVRDHTADLIAKVRTGEEAKDGINAFLEKRRPNWIKTSS